MRTRQTMQPSFLDLMPSHQMGRELVEISKILDERPEVLSLVMSDLVSGRRKDTGRCGMTAESVLRCAVLKQFRTMTYEELAFHLEDSLAYRNFARLWSESFPSSSTLQENIAKLGPATWEAIHRVVVAYAAARGIEKGRTVRIDTTVVETDIHHPLDSLLLADGIRLITRLLDEGKTLSPQPANLFSDHNRVAKRLVLTIKDAKKEKAREAAYRKLLSYAERVREYALCAIADLSGWDAFDVPQVFKARLVMERLERAVNILEKVIDQTHRRVVKGEKVPASEKVVSFFEEHTDIIVKDRRETIYGHKVCVAGGASSMILDCLMERGNPADSTLFTRMIERQKSLFGRVPRQTAADGGFASRNNLADAKATGVKDVAFSKGRGLAVSDMVKSSWVFKKLRNFRAGIEANISTLKRAFALDRCNWSGWEGFQSYAWSAIVAYNLAVMARHLLA